MLQLLVSAAPFVVAAAIWARRCYGRPLPRHHTLDVPSATDVLASLLSVIDSHTTSFWRLRADHRKTLAENVDLYAQVADLQAQLASRQTSMSTPSSPPIEAFTARSLPAAPPQPAVASASVDPSPAKPASPFPAAPAEVLKKKKKRRLRGGANARRRRAAEAALEASNASLS